MSDKATKTEAASDEAIFRELHSSLRRFAAICAPPWEEPDDLLQEAVAKVLRRQPLCELTNPGAYLRTTIANLARDRHRAGRPTSLTAPEVSCPDVYPSEIAILGELSPDDRALLYLVDIEGTSFRAAAEVLGISTTAAKARAIRARRRLRYVLERTQP